MARTVGWLKPALPPPTTHGSTPWTQGTWLQQLGPEMWPLGQLTLTPFLFYVHPPVLSSAPIGEQNHGHATVHTVAPTKVLLSQEGVGKPPNQHVHPDIPTGSLTHPLWQTPTLPTCKCSSHPSQGQGCRLGRGEDQAWPGRLNSKMAMPPGCRSKWTMGAMPSSHVQSSSSSTHGAMFVTLTAVSRDG